VPRLSLEVLNRYPTYLFSNHLYQNHYTVSDYLEEVVGGLSTSPTIDDLDVPAGMMD